MDIKQETVDFMLNNLHKTRAEYYIYLFKPMSQNGFNDRIIKYCNVAASYEMKNHLGKLDDDSVMLLITMRIMENAIDRRRINLNNSDDISIYASESEIQEARDDYARAEEQISKALRDYWVIKNRLIKNINECFKDELPLLLESAELFKKTPADFRTEESGYIFTFYRRDIYVTNWAPMGGD